MRTKPTTGNVGPREAGPHGVTLEMREVKQSAPSWIHQHDRGEGSLGSPPPAVPHVNGKRDRSLAGKARIRARKAARR